MEPFVVESFVIPRIHRVLDQLEEAREHLHVDHNEGEKENGLTKLDMAIGRLKAILDIE